jgi:lipopolysaccharide export system protein LptC
VTVASVGSETGRRKTVSGLPAHLSGAPQFLAAERHSRRVRWFKRAIPVLCLAVAGFLFVRAGASFFLDQVAGFNTGFTIKDRKIVMEKPRLSGFKRDGSSYEMLAEKAVQDLRLPNRVELRALSARIQQGAQGWTTLSGDEGLYDSKAEKLDVRGQVRVKTDGGAEAWLEEAFIDFKAGLVTSEKPVDVRMNSGRVTADALRVLDNGRQFVFEGRVQSEFTNSGTPENPR